MAYPNDLDELTNGVPSDVAAPATDLGDAVYPHDDHHRALASGLEAVQTELGLNPAGAELTVADRIAELEAVTATAEGIPTVINVVTDHGAAADGVTDDRAEVQAALDAAEAAGGGIVYLPEGTYLVGTAGSTNSLVSVPSKVTLRGAGPRASIIKSASAQDGHSPLEFAASATAARIESLGIDAASSTTSSHGVYAAATTDCAVLDVWVAAKFGWGVFIGSDSTSVSVVRCTIAGTTGSHGVEINGSSYCLVMGCHITNGGVNGANNIEIYDANTTRCVGNQLINNTLTGSGVAVAGGGILTAGDIGTIIRGNAIINPASYGIYLSSSAFDNARVARECIIEGNVVKGADAANVGTSGAIYLDFWGQRCTIIGNTVEDSANGCTGIRVDGVNNTIANNIAYSNGGHGVHVASTAHRTTASGNVCVDNSGFAVDVKFGLLSEGDACTIIGNVGSDTRGGSARQYHGISIGSSTNTVAIGNRGTGNRNIAFADAGTNTTNIGNEASTVNTKLPTGNLGLFGKTPVAQPTRAGQLTDSSGGTSGGNTIAAVTTVPTAANAIATLAARLNDLEGKISAAGTGIGVTA